MIGHNLDALKGIELLYGQEGRQVFICHFLQDARILEAGMGPLGRKIPAVKRDGRPTYVPIERPPLRRLYVDRTPIKRTPIQRRPIVGRSRTPLPAQPAAPAGSTDEVDLAAGQLLPGSVAVEAHGTVAGYEAGCRCTKCSGRARAVATRRRNAST